MDDWDLGDTENASDQLAFAQYLEDDIPNYWQYARHFALADHFFATMLGPTFPGHMFVLAAQAGWAIGNPDSNRSRRWYWGCDDPAGTTQSTCSTRAAARRKQVSPCFEIPDGGRQPAAGGDWKFYGSTLPPLVGEVWSMFDAVEHIRRRTRGRTTSSTPRVRRRRRRRQRCPTIVVPRRPGSRRRASAVQHLRRRELDRRPPQPRHAEPDYWDKHGDPLHAGRLRRLVRSRARRRGSTAATPTTPYGLGFRLPLIIISPYAKPGFVYSRVAQHASIPKFIEKVFGLPSLASQDPAAQDGPDTDDLTTAFDWTQPPAAAPGPHAAQLRRPRSLRTLGLRGAEVGGRLGGDDGCSLSRRSAVVFGEVGERRLRRLGRLAGRAREELLELAVEVGELRLQRLDVARPQRDLRRRA